MEKYLRTLVKFLPIIVMGIILFLSSLMFNIDKNQTYERVRKLKESQVQVIANQVDLGTSLDPEYAKKESNIRIVREAVESINEQEGVYCYLFDGEYNLISDLTQTKKHYTGEAVLESLKNNNLTILSSNGYYGHLSVAPIKGENLIVYWRGVPSGDRSNCDLYIVLAVCEDEVQENEAINSCKAMIGVLTILFGISLYGNLYVKPYFTDSNDKKQK